MTDEQWAALKQTIQTQHPEGATYNQCAVVELGNLPTVPAEIGPEGEVIMPAILSEKTAVDILWFDGEPEGFIQHQVWPKPCGVHVFQGFEQQYADEYAARQSA